MKLKIKKDLLLENLNKVSKAISTKNLIPTLAGIKFDLTKEGLTLTASNNDITIQKFIKIEKENMIVDKEGVVILQGKDIVDIVRVIPEEEFNIEVFDDAKVLIYTDDEKIKYDLNVINKNDYPNVSLEKSENFVTITASDLLDIVKETAFATSNDESRPVLTGISFKVNGDLLECIATDSYRLAKKIINLEEPTKEEINIVIPGKNIIELDKIIVDDENVEMHVFSNKILFKYKNLIFQSNLLSGTYPNTTNLIPTDFSIIINTKLADYYSAIDRAALLTQGKDKNIVKMKVKDSQMVINSYASEIGKVEEKLEIETSNDANIDISFSAKYMLDALKTMKDEEILILLNGEVKPIVIKSVTDESLIQLILPIKTY